MRVLDRKLLRDLRRLGTQAVAIALVMACGAAVIVLGSGSARSLERTAEAFYERYRFADVFASATRAPLHLADALLEIPGVAAIEPRVVDAVLLDLVGMAETATGLAVSVPDRGEPALNRLYIRLGRLPDPARPTEVAINERFADAHGFGPGDRFTAIMNGKRRELLVTGVVLSPEFVYTIGPGDMIPDNRRFGVLYMPRRTLEGVFDMEGAFNDVLLGLSRGADPAAVIEALDRLLASYGGSGAYEREDQLSAAFVEGELEGLKAFARVIPPVFLFVSAFLVNMILARLVALEREQVGLLKAIGYSGRAVAWHYMKLVIVVALAGVALGVVAGTWLGAGLTQIYVKYYTFPFLLFDRSPDLYVIAAGVTVLAALLGAANAVRATVALPPAVAMAPAAPPSYRSAAARESIRRLAHRFVSELGVMAFRHLVRWPLRTALTVLGTALSVALLIVATFTYGSIDLMVDTLFFNASRQDADLHFVGDTHPSAIDEIARWPGVLAAEPFRVTPVSLRHGHLEKRVELIGVPAGATLDRVLDERLTPFALPSRGITVSEQVAEQLDLRVGDRVDATLLAAGDAQRRLTVTGIAREFVGVPVYMRLDALDRTMPGGPRVSGVRVTLDGAALDGVYERVKETTRIPAVGLLGSALGNFRETIEENILISMTIYVTLAVTVTFGVIYNAARIQLSERARELASLRIFGFTRAEVSSVLIFELALIVILAQPLGWLLGRGFAGLVTRGFESDIYRLPLVVEPSVYATASLIVGLAAAVSLATVRRRVDRLDLVAVLKTRE